MTAHTAEIARRLAWLVTCLAGEFGALGQAAAEHIPPGPARDELLARITQVTAETRAELTALAGPAAAGRPRNRRGHASLAVLGALREGHTYGAQIMRVTGLPGGTVYPALHRLEHAGVVTSRLDTRPGPGPARRIYHLTEKETAHA